VTEASVPLALPAEVTIKVGDLEIQTFADQFELTGMARMWGRYQVKGHSAIPAEKRTVYMDFLTHQVTQENPGFRFSTVDPGLFMATQPPEDEGGSFVGLEFGEE
jgi:hypothetical protein